MRSRSDERGERGGHASSKPSRAGWSHHRLLDLFGGQGMSRLTSEFFPAIGTEGGAVFMRLRWMTVGEGTQEETSGCRVSLLFSSNVYVVS